MSAGRALNFLNLLLFNIIEQTLRFLQNVPQLTLKLITRVQDALTEERLQSVRVVLEGVDR